MEGDHSTIPDQLFSATVSPLPFQRRLQSAYGLAGQADHEEEEMQARGQFGNFWLDSRIDYWIDCKKVSTNEEKSRKGEDKQEDDEVSTSSSAAWMRD